MVQDRVTLALPVGIRWSPGFSRSFFRLRPGLQQGFRNAVAQSILKWSSHFIQTDSIGMEPGGRHESAWLGPPKNGMFSNPFRFDCTHSILR
jgi:hypothetical protein